MQQALITTIIPTYKRPVLLRRAVLSVLKQTFQDFRICIYDNASHDESESICRAFMACDSRIAYFKHSQTIGVIDNFNFALHRIETPFYSLLSDDDMLAPGFLEGALSGFERHPEACFAVTNMITVDTKMKIVDNRQEITSSRFFAAGEGSLLALQGRLPGFWTNCLFKKEVLQRIGYYDASLQPLADFAYTMRMYMRLPFVLCPSLGSVVMVHQNSGSSSHEPMSYVSRELIEKVSHSIKDSTLLTHNQEILLNNYLRPNYTKSALTQIARALRSQDWHIASDAAKELQVYGHPWQSKFLLAFILLHARVGFARSFFKFLFWLQAKRLQYMRRSLTRKFSDRLHFVTELNNASGFVDVGTTRRSHPL